jgi:hypothetical protein
LKFESEQHKAYFSNVQLETNQLSLRLDSRGEPINRAIIGDKQLYKSFDVQNTEALKN